MQRTHKNKINHSSSSLQAVKTGVPQSLILSPLLFTIFINELTLVPFNGAIQLYADDAVITYSTTSLEQLHLIMSQDLMLLKDWLKKNLLELNVRKTKYILFEGKFMDRITLNTFTLQLGENVIEKVDEFTYLGLVLNSKLKWNSHVDKIKRRIAPYVFAIKRAAYILPIGSLKLLYNSYILSHIVYLNPVWSGCTSEKLNELFVLQKQVLKYMLHLPRKFPTARLFEEYSFISIENINKVQMYLLAFRICNNKLKHNFELKTAAEQHTHETRRRSYYLIQFFSTNRGESNFLYRGLQLFNLLPHHIKHEKSFEKFKLQILNYVSPKTIGC